MAVNAAAVPGKVTPVCPLYQTVCRRLSNSDDSGLLEFSQRRLHIGIATRLGTELFESVIRTEFFKCHWPI